MKYISSGLRSFQRHVGRQEVIVAGGAALVTASQVASAALDASISTGLTAVQGDFTSLLALAYPVMISVTGAVVLFSLSKGFIKRAFGK